MVRMCFAHIISTVTYLSLLLACIDILLLFLAPRVVSEACLHTHECNLFGLLVAWVVQNVYDRTDPFSHFLCSFWGYPPIRI